jgi:hypothetical protein
MVKVHAILFPAKIQLQTSTMSQAAKLHFQIFGVFAHFWGPTAPHTILGPATLTHTPPPIPSFSTFVSNYFL